MKIAVLGATGKTGGQLVQQALDRGYDVVALCRNPSKMAVQHDKLQAVQADVFSVDSLKPHFTDCDAVFSCLGRSNTFTIYESTFYCNSMKVITQAMREAGVSRLVCMTSWVTEYRSDPGSFFVEWMLKPFMRVLGRRILDDMRRMELHLIDDCQDICYTIVRPGGLFNGPVTDTLVECEEDGQYVYSVSMGRIWISRADVAKFMLSTLSTSEFDRKAVAIAVQ